MYIYMSCKQYIKENGETLSVKLFGYHFREKRTHFVRVIDK